MKYLLTATVFLACAVATAGATSLKQPYMDDRSDVVALIRSHYNALVRKEFARAWSYYGEEHPPGDFEAFETEWQGIASVDLAFGEVFAEGAAGSVFYQVPAAVLITREDGSKEQSAGCVLARLVNPQIQGVPFRPMRLVSDTLESASGPLEDALPASCGDG